METKNMQASLQEGAQDVIEQAAALQRRLDTKNPDFAELEIRLAVIFGTTAIVDLPGYPR
ncbi:MAG: hypothetical protein HGA38_02380 [Candidatus Moranbacteria bacterium]|nr:hypothetical protein [Candidatus Moranbacteria bacterium]NTW45734.1 hypothetical protein [Candidatus Moranbacteria bacterium]